MAKILVTGATGYILELIESAPGVVGVSENVKILTKTNGIKFKTWASENKNAFI